MARCDIVASPMRYSRVDEDRDNDRRDGSGQRLLLATRCLKLKKSSLKLPNIIFIMADDMGYGDAGCYNPESRIPTPNMDRLAAAGTRFTDAHAPSAVCTPSRYGVLTGRYCWRTRLKEGVTGGYAAPLIEKERLTVASLLKQAGYDTACIGKWHVGLTFQDADGNPTEIEEQVDFARPVTGGPTELGFDYAYYNAGCGTCAPPYGFIENGHFVDKDFSLFDPGKDGPVQVGSFGQWRGMMGAGWVTAEADVTIAEKACEYMTKSADQEAPFFLYLAPNAPHEPCVEKFVPELARGQSDAGARGDLVWLFDWIVGRVIKTLEETNQADNTLLIVTSDNGALPGDFVLDGNGNRVEAGTGEHEYRYRTYGHTSNGDWRGYKAHIWEGGHREPMIARWPGVVQPGMVSDQTVCLTDFLATCAEITDSDLPEDAAEDSFSFLHLLTGDDPDEKAGRPARKAIIHHSGYGVFSIRRGRWKLISGTKGSGGWPTPRGTRPSPGAPGQLYDIATDPAEMCDLWEKRPDIVKSLSQLLEDYQKNGSLCRCRQNPNNT